MKFNNQQPLMTSLWKRAIFTRIISYEVEKGGYSPTDTSDIINGSVEDSQLKSSLFPVDIIPKEEVSK